MNEDQIQRQKQKWLNKFQKANIYSSVIRQLLESTHQQSWYILNQCITSLMKTKQRQIERSLQQLDRQVDKISTFTMLLYVYSLKIRYSIRQLKYISWKSLYSKICFFDNELLIFNSWISSAHKQKIVQESLEMVITSFLQMFKTEYSLQLTEKELQSVIYWLSYFNTTDQKKFNLVCALSKYVKEKSIYSPQDYQPKDHLMLKKIIEIVGMSKDNTGNAFLLLYPMNFKQKELNYFCNLEQDFLQGLAEQHILNVFFALTKVALSRQIIMILDKLSRLFLSSDQFFKLRLLYQSVILPRIVKRSKFCPKLCQLVYELGSFYIIGFMNHCDIGEQGINCIVTGIGKIKNIQIQKKWVNLCAVLICQYPFYEQIIVQNLRKQKVLKERQKIELEHSVFQSAEIWTVTARNGRKHKIYPKSKSTIYKGIQNQSNDCYIITVVQALFMTRKLQPFLNQNKHLIKQKCHLLNQLRVLFQALSGKIRSDKIVVKFLKNNGPQIFAESHYQEDAQQYLSSLFDQIQKLLKKDSKLLEAFKNIFQSTFLTKIMCKHCGCTKQRQQREYFITINHNQTLQPSNQTALDDYKCQECSKMQATIEKILKPNSEVMIVHINRFEHLKGKTKKLLSTQTIHRKIMGYELNGIIFHFGRDVQHGHYVYYSKIAKIKWVEMNDATVNQFTLDKEDQQFERQMKSQMTPYILFYTKKQEGK